MKLIKEHDRAGVRWELSDEGKHVVTAAGEVLVITVVDTLAEMTYDEAIEERDPVRRLRERERAHYDMQAVRSDSFARRAANSRKKGGKGGRGGV
ncbi:hypothetical protein [Tsukamurella sp. USMM236]|uniref:hypothetical protein n=1 Tax=Tsukamurella sp. USMM236 TaxID=3081301 RepID=UPI00301827E2